MDLTIYVEIILGVMVDVYANAKLLEIPMNKRIKAVRIERRREYELSRR